MALTFVPMMFWFDWHLHWHLLDGGLEREWLRPARISGCLLTVGGFLGRAHTWLSEERDEETLSEEL